MASGAPGRLSTLIDRITAAVPSADVFVATIIPLANAGQENAARAFNATIPGIVQSKVSAGRRVHLVDMHAALTTADLIDGIHPTAGGYDKMAATWYAALRSVPGTIGDPVSGTGGALVGTASGRCLDVPNGSTTNGVQPIIWDCSGGANQRWAFTSGGTIRNAQSGLCLDVNGGATANGTATILWTCTNAPNQLWTRR
ncbi:RICIN domain-containing protein [Actinoplanes sp. NPDC051861]|uniref:RICIN domain-containing protein n=1 Tax=Actinoplanes sp. NPDC051861 TaxID=3155170 RepID=UPI003434314E